MKTLAWVIIIEAFISFPLTFFGLTYKDNYAFCFIIIAVNTLALMATLTVTFKKQGQSTFILLFFVSYAIRMILVFTDPFSISSNDDSLAYQKSASLFFYENKPHFRGVFHFYALFSGCIYKVFGDNTLLFQHFGVLMGVGGAWYIYKTLCLLSVSETSKKIGILWAVFSPNLFRSLTIYSTETWTYFLIAVSVFYFIKWHKEGKFASLAAAGIFCLWASLFNAGLLSLGLGYAVVFVLYDFKKRRFAFRIKTVIIGTVIALAFTVVFTSALRPVLFRKFARLESVEGVSSRTRPSPRAGSGYTAATSASGVQGIVVYTPVRMIYFLGSPMPWDWRGLIDIAAFFASGFIHLSIVFFFARYYFLAKKHSTERKFLLTMIIITFCALITFAWGVSNAGTAIRHRDKLVALFAVMLAVLADKKRIFYNQRQL